MPDAHGKEGGRIMVTSLCCLTLEVYYRYLPLYKLDTPERTEDGRPRPAQKPRRGRNIAGAVILRRVRRSGTLTRCASEGSSFCVPSLVATTLKHRRVQWLTLRRVWQSTGSHGAGTSHRNRRGRFPDARDPPVPRPPAAPSQCGRFSMPPTRAATAKWRSTISSGSRPPIDSPATSPKRSISNCRDSTGWPSTRPLTRPKPRSDWPRPKRTSTSF